MIRRQKVDFDKVTNRINCLRDIPDRVEGIELIVLFGSLAAGRPQPLSDIDVAFQVVNLDRTKRAEIWGQTTDALGTDEVDIVYLNDDLPYCLKYEIGWSGRLLYEASPGLFSLFRVRAAAMWYDFKPYADYRREKFFEHIRKVGIGK